MRRRVSGTARRWLGVLSDAPSRGDLVPLNAVDLASAPDQQRAKRGLDDSAAPAVLAIRKKRRCVLSHDAIEATVRPQPGSVSKISIVAILAATPHEHLDLDLGLTSLDDANLFRRGRRQVDNGAFTPILTIRPAIHDHNVD